jgi:hypothetical protein
LGEVAVVGELVVPAQGESRFVLEPVDVVELDAVETLAPALAEAVFHDRPEQVQPGDVEPTLSRPAVEPRPLTESGKRPASGRQFSQEPALT